MPDTNDVSSKRGLLTARNISVHAQPEWNTGSKGWAGASA